VDTKIRLAISFSVVQESGRVFHSLSPNSDENEISLYTITACSNIQVMRIKERITKDKMSWYLDKFSLLVSLEMCGELWGEYAFLYQGLKG